jgi:hypothetical protein
VLSITCDNVSINDVMIDKLEEFLTDFPGATNRTRCFAHILNLVVKTIMKCFDVAKDTGSNADDSDNEEFDVNESYMKDFMKDLETGENMEDMEDNNEGWVNEEEFLDPEELKELKVSIMLIQGLLVKVRDKTNEYIS